MTCLNAVGTNGLRLKMSAVKSQQEGHTSAPVGWKIETGCFPLIALSFLVIQGSQEHLSPRQGQGGPPFFSFSRSQHGWANLGDGTVWKFPLKSVLRMPRLGASPVS